MPWLRGITVWFLIILVESVHGTLRQLYLAPLVGDVPARRLAVFTGSVLIFLIAVGTARWLGARSTQAALVVGGMWVLLTLCFEFGLGRVVLGYDWPRIVEDYDLSRGGLMGFGLLAMLLSPLVAARIRRVGHAAL